MSSALTACGVLSMESSDNPANEELTLFTAASLTDAFEEIGQQFENNHTNIAVELNIAGSSQLSQQIIRGAPADVFASANRTQMDVVVDAGVLDRQQVELFAYNELVVVYPRANLAQLMTLTDLSRPEVKLVVAAEEVPVGSYTQTFLDNASRDSAFSPSYKTDVLENIVSYEQNVRAVLNKVMLGEADAGVVYRSDVFANVDQTAIAILEIPEHLNVQAAYYIAPVRDTSLSRQFVDTVLSPAGQAILESYGFVPLE
ncbi:MAG: molybdate ABC transporter substrate-binding protein [Chloroflexi bacterium AL-W]|nr:molybdate ABC transporter substrate-binding protein [Chloroflexi bacterium AL-N1]NOK70596.1 molybdate ABC transporter substrate-binding protein [Chloroflexi bacterium AL-N10]NOK77588.1 molybdate ABC transporter substrate-binding protein [Chloroflexi bacterium AL-N5]NOK84439.1 molybdate ABC transporter substrate-binding protein [Chloroflexi bacterium AL-W]NOK92328.1 molybdate ABC transporter substrate-binding protein [Chloroflexi bacterium AL-N15]